MTAVTVPEPLDHVLRAVADPVRRGVLDELRQGPAPARTLGADVPISQPAFSQHLRVLREAGLVEVEPRGRERWYHLRAAPLAQLRDWVTHYERFWADALDRLGEHLDATATGPPDGPPHPGANP